MQYVAGGSLADLLKREGPLGWQRAARYVADVGEGLLEVHARGIVHRDVKPANILWEPRRDEAILTDFGVGARLSDPAGVAGSLLYMATEGLDGRIAPSLDVYSLASTCFHLVTGETPFAGTRISDYKAQIAQGLPAPDPRCSRPSRPARAGDPRRPVRRARDERPRVCARVRRHACEGSLDQLHRRHAIRAARATERRAGRGPVALRLHVSRRVRRRPVMSTWPTTHPRPDRLTRGDMKRVPRPPDQVSPAHRRPGTAHRGGRRPAGLPDRVQRRPGRTLEPALPRPVSRPIPRPPVEAQSAAEHLGRRHDPASRVQVAAVRRLDTTALFPAPRSVAQSGRTHTKASLPASRPYVATRDMKRVQQTVQQLRPEDWHAVGLELDHGA